MDHAEAIAILDRPHSAQNTLYGGGDDRAIQALLSPGVTWTVPGSSPIAGSYHGLEEVLTYFVDRRNRAAGAFRLHRRDVLVGTGSRIAALTDGTASIHGAGHAWSTIGLYEVSNNAKITACWLLPLDPPAFDAIWSE